MHEVNSGIIVFPNPAGSELNINSETFFDKVTIYNADGRMLMHKDYGIPTKSEKLKLDLDPGLYILVVSGSEKAETIKLIIR